MKRIALSVVAGLVLTACAAKEQTPPADSAGSMAAPAAAAPAPTMDSGAMKADSMTKMAPPMDPKKP